MRLGYFSKLVRNFYSNKFCRTASSSFYPFNNKLFNLNDDDSQLRETVFNLCQKELFPYADKIDKDDDWDMRKEFWLKLGSLGLLGVTAPQIYGGSEMKYFQHCLIAEQISRASASIGLSYGAHSNLCLNQISRHGTEQQKSKYLPKLCTGEFFGALAMSEVTSGSDVVSMKAQASKCEGGFRLNGSKFWITNGPIADVVVMYARTTGVPSCDKQQLPQHKITAFILERSMFEHGPKLDKFGMRGSHTSELIFNDVFVPDENVLGKVGAGVYVLMSGLDLERLVLASGPVGIMQACCDLAFDYCHQRHQFQKPIGHFQLIQAKMADLYCDLNASRAYLYTVARACDEGYFSAKDCAGVILFCSEKAVNSAMQTIQLLGGNGYINEYSAGRLFRDAKLYDIGAGTNEIRRLVIGRALNDEYK